MTDRYLTIERPGTSVYRELASRFIGFAFHAPDVAAFKKELDRIAKEHHASRHVCYAYRLGATGKEERSNDAGEPSGTAGMPILRAIRGSQLTCSAVVVVRYFGGTLLGTAGLVRAYGEAARMAIDSASTLEHVVLGRITYTCSYALYEQIKLEVAGLGGVLAEGSFSDHCAGTVGVPLGSLEDVILRWQAQGITAERVDQPK